MSNPIRKKYPEGVRLEPSKTEGVDLSDGNYWESKRNATFPQVLVSPDAANDKVYTIYAQDAWKIVLSWNPGGGPGSSCVLLFSNGTEINMQELIQGGFANISLGGQPYIKRSDIIQATITNGTLFVYRDVITVNVEKPGQ